MTILKIFARLTLFNAVTAMLPVLLCHADAWLDRLSAKRVLQNTKIFLLNDYVSFYLFLSCFTKHKQLKLNTSPADEKYKECVEYILTFILTFNSVFMFQEVYSSKQYEQMRKHIFVTSDELNIDYPKPPNLVYRVFVLSK